MAQSTAGRYDAVVETCSSHQGWYLGVGNDLPENHCERLITSRGVSGQLPCGIERVVFDRCF